MKLKTFNKEDYNKLNHLSFNRKFSVRNDLVEKMNLYGFTVPINIISTDVIDGKTKLYIADGQHRALSAVYIGIDFIGVINDIKFTKISEIVEYVSSLNSTSKAWRAIDYVEAYNHLNLSDYQILLRIKNNCPYSVETLASILAGNRGRGAVAGKIKNGTFKVTDLEYTQYILTLAGNLSKYEKLSSRMLLALSNTARLKRFNESKFISAYRKNAKFVKDLKLDDYTDIFQSWV